ncbi:hypothetical protein LQ567_16700 [Niabella pedocola]|uniref:Uncharacterized protein n=1 Tax=Niabella pedocola TaxID=1752077 RepID=A0ABS8PTL5_9BACT|nr:hypothetical protein [Niabella pedocola]MCD2424421.1 hypothetical protein [Niabella pedocola]
MFNYILSEIQNEILLNIDSVSEKGSLFRNTGILSFLHLTEKTSILKSTQSSLLKNSYDHGKGNKGEIVACLLQSCNLRQNENSNYLEDKINLLLTLKWSDLSEVNRYTFCLVHSIFEILPHVKDIESDLLLKMQLLYFLDATLNLCNTLEEYLIKDYDIFSDHENLCLAAQISKKAIEANFAKKQFKKVLNRFNLILESTILGIYTIVSDKNSNNSSSINLDHILNLFVKSYKCLLSTHSNAPKRLKEKFDFILRFFSSYNSIEHAKQEEIDSKICRTCSTIMNLLAIKASIRNKQEILHILQLQFDYIKHLLNDREQNNTAKNETKLDVLFSLAGLGMYLIHESKNKLVDNSIYIYN